MALTRKMLSAMGVDDEKATEILNAYQETLQSIKDERDKLKEAAETAEKTIQQQADQLKELDALKEVRQQLEAANGELNSLKASAVTERKAAALQDALKAANVRPSAAKLIARGVDLDALELDGDALRDADAVLAPLKTEYADLFGQPGGRGTPPANPPAGQGAKLTRADIQNMSPEDINKNWDAVKAALGS